MAQQVANEIKSVMDKSGLRPKKVQQELLKLIGQQNAAKRSSSAAPSAAPSRRVSVDETPVNFLFHDLSFSFIPTSFCCASKTISYCQPFHFGFHF